MRCRLISDNRDTLIGMRLAGIPGIVVHDRDSVCQALDEAMHDETVAVVMLTEKIEALCTDVVRRYKETVSKPLIVVIPDRHGGSDLTAAMSQYLAETVGIRI